MLSLVLRRSHFDEMVIGYADLGDGSNCPVTWDRQGGFNHLSCGRSRFPMEIVVLYAQVTRLAEGSEAQIWAVVYSTHQWRDQWGTLGDTFLVTKFFRWGVRQLPFTHLTPHGEMAAEQALRLSEDGETGANGPWKAVAEGQVDNHVKKTCAMAWSRIKDNFGQGPDLFRIP